MSAAAMARPIGDRHGAGMPPRLDSRSLPNMAANSPAPVGRAPAIGGVLETARLMVVVGTQTAAGAARGLMALPRIAIALERLADSSAELTRLAEAAPAVEAIAAVAAELRQLLAREATAADIAAVRSALVGLSETAASLRPLSQSVVQLNEVVASLNTAVSPLQGASERLGRFVDRIPNRRRVVDVDDEG